jgi:hypothetical protein
MILGNFGGPGAHFRGPGAHFGCPGAHFVGPGTHFEDFGDRCDFMSVRGTKYLPPFGVSFDDINTFFAV